MSNEPMFNIQERAPMQLAAVLVIMQALMSFGPGFLKITVYNAALLVPMGFPGASPVRQGFSLIGHGFLHGGWTHALVNIGMIVAFGVMTLRGVRALAAAKGHPSRAAIVFFSIFLLGTIGGGLFQWGWWALTDVLRASALGASGGASALFATAAWAMGGRDQLIKFGMGWALLNVIFVLAAPIFGGIAWAAHMGGYCVGALLAPYWVKPFSTGFSITR